MKSRNLNLLTLILAGYMCPFNFQDASDDILMCRQCGFEVTVPKQIKNVVTKYSIKHRYLTIMGVPKTLAQTLRNSQGRKYEVITVSSALVEGFDKFYEENSWFPGYSWQICACPKCHQHLGWIFKDSMKSVNDRADFVALILKHHIHKKYADSLINVNQERLNS